MARTKSAANAILYYEAGQTYVPMAALTDADDGTKWTSPDEQWSGYEGKEPVVRPEGLVTGGVITPAVSGTDDLVDVAACTVYVAGVLVSVPADTDLTCLRGADADVCRINSIVVTAGAYAVASGTDGAAFSATRNAAGGPPLIPVGSVEVGQIRFGAIANDPVEEDEIFQVPGTHQERSDYPVWDEDWAEGEIEFAASLGEDHVGPTRRRVYAAYYTPIFAEIPNSSDFVPAEQNHSVSSTQIYGGTVGARSSTLGQGSFTARLAVGVTDNLVSHKNKNLWFKFYPDRYRDENILTQGVLGVSRQFPAGDAIIANCTISADAVSIDKES